MRSFVASLAAAMIAGGAVTGGVLYKFTPAVAPQASANMTKLQQVYSVLQNQYYQPLEGDKLMEGAIDGLVKAADDPYTTYMNAAETKSFMENISSSFEGIGAELKEEDGNIVVVSPIHGSPGEKAGVKPNDIFLEVNGENLVGMKLTDAVTKIRGPKGTKAVLKIKRPGVENPFELTIVRDTIPLETVFTEMRPDGIGIIRISKESETTAAEFTKAFSSLKAQGAKGIVLDMRGNPGGLLDQAIKISSQFLPKGKLILQQKYRDGSVQEARSQGPGNDFPTVVLVDKGSASAAEIISGALRESAGIPLVGETTYGKGLVQTTTDLHDGSLLKYTSAQWLTPEGHQINKQGIKPDYEVKLPDYAELPYPMVEKEYKQGEQAVEIGTVQKMLKALGYEPGREDGLLDAKTGDALKAFQQANKLEATGTLNPATTAKAITLLQEKIKANDTQMEKAIEVLKGRMAR
ncbi:MAG TPA: S41 family peptidase [Symbiobacteriaceae bacterium]|nr:S41 family peptidase [Symbiobacteriaceae bacterium]